MTGTVTLELRRGNDYSILNTLDGVLVVDAGHQALVGDVQQGDADCLGVGYVQIDYRWNDGISDHDDGSP